MPAPTFDQLAAALHTLVDAAQSAAARADEPAMRSAHAALADFIARSDDRVPGVRELDDLAAHTMRDLTIARLGKALEADLASRGAAIARLTKRFADA